MATAKMKFLLGYNLKIVNQWGQGEVCWGNFG